jgi:aspartyl-tRNA(Asn)/glutamyl-tRNA(Gln) amidotransferase subunit A
MLKKAVYILIISLSLLSCVSPSFPVNQTNFNLEEATIDQIHAAIKSNKLTCKQLVGMYIDRIKLYNLSTRDSAPLNAFTELNRSVFEQAEKLDESYAKSKKLSGPLHCIPLVIKDNIDSYDTTTASGSYSLHGNQPINDAFLVKQLRDAGAIIIGKTNMDEFAWGISSISSRSGRTGNSYDHSQNPGGSSGGTGVAVSANFALAGIGTDNSGSIRIPAAFNGLVGLRPSTGLISQSGLFPMGKLDGVAGPMARNVKDLAIILDIITKKDASDPKTLNVPSRNFSYTDYLNEAGLQRKRIGILTKVNNINTFADMHPDILNTMKNSWQKMETIGATIIPDINIVNFNSDLKYNQAGEIEDINEYLSSFPSTRKDFAEICKSDKTRNFGSAKECFSFMNKIPKRNSQEYRNTIKKFDKNKKLVEAVMTENKLDALFIPIAITGSATYDPNMINTWRAPISSNAGLPSIAFNIGYDKNNLPIGIELVAKQFDEANLFAMAYAYEQHFPSRIKPKLSSANKALLNLTLAEINNLITLLGRDTYENVLKKGKSSDLTAEIFNQLTKEKITKYLNEK